MRADRTVIVIGAFLFIVGLAVAWNGYGYVQLERGWSLVISGTFGFCTGLVLIALGLVLRELEAISSSAAKATLLLAKAKTNGQAEIPAAEPVPEAPALSAPSEPKPDGPLSWMVRAKRTETSPALRMPRAEASDEWLSHPLADRSRTQADENFAAATVVETVVEAAPEEPLEPALEPVAPHEPEPVWAGAYEPLAEAAPEPEPEPAFEPAPEPAFEAEPEPVLEPVHEVISEPAPEAIREPAQAPALEPVHEPVAEQAPETEPKPAIIGHYDAQGAHYTLYADGSIEADTPHGVYRFATMAELKRFIEGEG